MLPTKYVDDLKWYKRIVYESLITQTEAAYKIKWGGNEMWVPKSICKRVMPSEHSMFVHASVFQKLKGY